MLVKIENTSVSKYPYTLGELKTDNPNISFPIEITDQLLAEFNVFRVNMTQKPIYNEMTELVVEGFPVLVNNVWQQTWTVSEMSDDEKQFKYEQKSDEVRTARNKLLQESDWTMLADSPITNKNDWISYRQQLRDVTSQTGFPSSVSWPIAPV